MSHPVRADRSFELGPLLARAMAAVALAAVLLALLLVLFSSGGTYEVNAIFDDARGLIEGGEVKAGSVTVGQIEDITIGDDGLPHVRMSVDDDFRLRQGAFANLKVASNIGAINRYVDLQQGDGPELPDGATLGPSHTDQPVDLDLAVSTLDPETRRNLAAVIASVDAATKGHGHDVDLILRHSTEAVGETADLLNQVTVDQAALSSIVSDTRRVVGALAQDPESLTGTADELAGVLRVAAGRQAELRRSVTAIGPGLASARGALNALAGGTDDLRSFFIAAGPAVAELEPTGELLRPAINALRPVLAEASKLIAEAPGELRMLRPVLNLAPGVVKRLGPISDGFNPFLDHLRARLPEIINFFVLAGDATSSYDANGNMIRATAIPIQLARHPNLIGPSDSGAGAVIRPFDRTPGSLEGEPWEDYWKSFIGGGKPPQSYIDPDEESP